MSLLGFGCQNLQYKTVTHLQYKNDLFSPKLIKNVFVSKVIYLFSNVLSQWQIRVV